MRIRHTAIPSKFSNSTIYYKGGFMHHECGPTVVDRLYGCGYFIGGMNLNVIASNQWESYG